ncbi:MAG: RDD family protein [Roseovarius gahaiensis]
MTEVSWHIPDPATQPEFYSDVVAKRLLAWIIDTVLIVLICLLIVPFTAFTGLFFFPFLLLTVGFAYRVITIAQGSATWGMRVVALEFRKMNGQRFDLAMAFLHTLGLTVSFGLPVLQVISIVLMLTTERRQGLSDHLLGTVALNRRASV